MFVSSELQQLAVTLVFISLACVGRVYNLKRRELPLSHCNLTKICLRKYSDAQINATLRSLLKST